MGKGPQQTAGDQPEVDEIALGIIDAAREEFVRFGIRRANMEEIARRAGVARVTVYRRFDSKSTLLRAVVMMEVLQFADRFDAVLSGDEPIAERLAAATALSIQELRQHPLMSTVLRADPEALLLALTLEGQTEFELIKGMLAMRLATLVDQGDVTVSDPSRVAELILRLIYTTFLMPFGELPGRTDAQVRAFAHEFVVPLVTGSARA